MFLAVFSNIIITFESVPAELLSSRSYIEKKKESEWEKERRYKRIGEERIGEESKEVREDIRRGLEGSLKER